MRDEDDEAGEEESPAAATPRIRVAVTKTAAPAIAGPNTIHLSWGDSQSGPFFTFRD